MANNLPAFHLAVVIDSTNKWIDVDPAGPPPVDQVSIAEATYDSMYDVVVALQTALQVVDANYTAVIDADGNVVIANSNTIFNIEWATGPNTANTIGTLLGFDVSADDIGAQTYTSDYQHMYAFYPEEPLHYDSYDRTRSLGPETFVPISGDAETTTFGEQTVRDIEMEFIPDTKYFPALSGTNEDFITFWEEAIAGTPFEFFSDTDDWTSEGEYKLFKQANQDLLSDPRLSEGSPYYSHAFNGMIKQ